MHTRASSMLIKWLQPDKVKESIIQKMPRRPCIPIIGINANIVNIYRYFIITILYCRQVDYNP